MSSAIKEANSCISSYYVFLIDPKFEGVENLVGFSTRSKYLIVNMCVESFYTIEIKWGELLREWRSRKIVQLIFDTYNFLAKILT